MNDKVLYGSEKASIIASVAGILKREGQEELPLKVKDIIAAHVGVLLAEGYSLGDIRYAAVELALAGEPLDLIAAVLESFAPAGRAAARDSE